MFFILFFVDLSLIYNVNLCCEIESCSVMSDSLSPHRLYSPWNSPGRNNGVGTLSLLQGVFLTQRLNPGLPHGRRILYQLCHKGSPRILEWVAYPFSRGSSWPRNWTRVSSIAGRFFMNQVVQQSKPVIHTYTLYILFYFFPLWFVTGYWIR